MHYFISRWQELNGWLKLIVCFCALGCLANGILIGRDLSSSGVLLRLHIGFFVLYAAQIIFIFLQERMVWVIAVLQGILALLTNADFTFVPLVRVVGRIVYSLSTPTVESLKEYKYVLISLSFTLQMLSAYAEFSLLPKKNSPVSPASTTTEEKTADHTNP